MRKVVGLAATAAALAATGVAPADATVVGTLSASRTTGSFPSLIITNSSQTAFTGLKLDAKLKSWTHGTSVSMPLLNGTKATLAAGVRKTYTVTNANHYFGFAGTTVGTPHGNAAHGSATKATKSMTFRVVANNAVSTAPFGSSGFNWFGFGKNASATSAFAGNLAAVTSAAATSVPEPASVFLLTAGLVGLGMMKRRMRA